MEWIATIIFIYAIVGILTFSLKATLNTIGPSAVYAIFWPIVFFFYLLKYAIRGSINYVKDFWK